jgi:hypothetical protein
METKMNEQSPDLYAWYHKALRRELGAFLTAIGDTDPADHAAWDRIARRWRKLDATLEAHSSHEDGFLHPLIREAAPAVEAEMEAQHHALEETLAALRSGFSAIESEVNPLARRAAAHGLYVRFSGFLADYFRHLVAEETLAMPALQARYTAAELNATRAAMLATIPPDKAAEDLALMAPALAPHERMALLYAMQAKAPPPAFEGALAIVERAIGREAFAPLAAAFLPKAA